MLALPLNITPKGLAREENIKRALDQSIQLLLTTPRFSTPDLRFEIFNEHEGVVYNSANNEDYHGITGLYDKKISGSSKNLNTFASELKATLAEYEKRLSNVTVTMTYIREERNIYVTVKGDITATQEGYTFTTTIRVWK